MAAPTTEQIKLIRDYEPALYFWGNPGDPDVERFYPSNAKRYLEKAALRLATTTSSYDWTTPIIQANRISATEGEGDTGTVYLGQRNSSGAPLYLEAAGQQLFLEVSGWKPGEQHADLDNLAARYAPGGDLNDSQFWYHAEFFDAARLRRVFLDAADPGGEVVIFTSLLDPQGGQPAVLTDPALICYYLFYPGHEESLSGCIDPATGVLAKTARDFGSFAGEWSCIAVLLDRAAATADYVPKYVGLSNRNVGVINLTGEEVRTTMRLLPWSAMRTFGGNHPRFNVAKGSHALYVEGEAIPALRSDDPSAALCGSATPLVGPGHQYGPPFAAPVFAVLKVMAGAAAGSVFGPFGTVIGMGAGLIWGIAENESNDQVYYLDLSLPASLTPTVDAVSPTGFVIHPVGIRPDDVAGQTAEWRSADGVDVGGRLYDFTVDRTKQVLWGKDPDGLGYTGRWGPLVRDDLQTRRAGMTFPEFWRLFFDALVRNDPPARVIVLTQGTTWTVPADWNDANNTIELIGGGGGGSAANGDGNSGAGGGGGAYVKDTNVTLIPSAVVSIAVGAAGAGGATAGASGTTGADTTFVAMTAKGGAGGVTGATPKGGAGGDATNSIGALKYSGGNGGNADSASGSGGGGGGGGAGPDGAGAGGGASVFDGVTVGGGGGGGGNAAGSAGVSTSGSNNGGAGGTNNAGMGGGVGGTAGVNGAAGTAGGGGGGGFSAQTGNVNGTTGGTGSAGIDKVGGSTGPGGGGGGGGSGAGSGDGGGGGQAVGFGGGGGGGGRRGGASVKPGLGGNGVQGVIKITYTPK